MDNRYFTVQELQALKFYELPNPIYSQINLLSLIPVRSRLFPIWKLQGRTLIRDFSMLFYNAHEEYRFYQRKQNIRLCLNQKAEKENYHDKHKN